MNEPKLKTAVLGLDTNGLLLLEAARQVENLNILAVADTDTNLAEKVAEQYNCLAYDDYRQLIIQNQFDCLLVAAPIHTCVENLKAAVKKNFNILKLPPLARNFAEAAELIRLADELGTKFAVANSLRYTGGFASLPQLASDGQIKNVFLIDALCNVGGLNHPAWQADQKLAGGGVLLYDAYEIIDLVTENFGAAQQVYALNTNTAADRQQRLYRTEDTVVVNMKFTDTLIANLTANKTIGPARHQITLYTKEKILTFSDDFFAVTDLLGKPLQRTRTAHNLSASVKKQLTNFALAITAPDNNKLLGPAKAHLNNMAVIESAYLSARTAMPEEPERILKMTRVTP